MVPCRFVYEKMPVSLCEYKCMRMQVVSHWKENMEYVKRKHPHPLVLNENYLGNEGDACYLCKEEILPSPLAQSVYHCTGGTKRSVISKGYDVCAQKLCLFTP